MQLQKHWGCLFHLNEYKQNQMNLIHNCSYSKNKNCKNFIDVIKGKKYDNLKQKITIFINDHKLIDTIYNSIINNETKQSND